MAKLAAISKSVEGLSYELGHHWVTIGRAAGNSFQIAEPSVSGQHCEVQLCGEQLHVRDMRSTNGTFIQGRMVSEGVLKLGEILGLGEVELRFEFSPVPKVPVVKISSLQLPEEAHGALPETTSSKPHEVLLVDDSMAFLETLSDLFETLGHKSWKIHKATGADQALAILHRHQIELAVFDINMPMLDGVQLLRIAHRRYPDVKKVVLTGMANEDHRAACLANGAELFIEKPVAAEGIRFVFEVLNDLIGWNQREGFSGTLRQVGLSDVIQIQCLSNNSCVLEVRNSKTEGSIYIEGGVIVHATAGALAGEEALYQLLSMNNGEFHFKPFKRPAERTVQGSWEFLLMEAARMRDEEKDARATDDTAMVQRIPPTASARVPDHDVLSPLPPDTPSADPSAEMAIKDLEAAGTEFIVVSTYDGEWHAEKGAK